MIENRPWGWFENLHELEKVYKVKRLFLKPNKRISLQYHLNREEYWIVVEGSGTLTLEDKTKLIKEGDYVYIPQNMIHRIEGGENGIMIIEVQKGLLCNEDDIVRLEDDYGRI